MQSSGMTDQQRKKLAAHEAGHATIREVLRSGSVLYATIADDDPHVRPTRVLAECDERVAILAGIAAEFFFFPDETKVGNYGGDDWERTAGWSEEEMREASTRTKELVTKHSNAIRKVANELLASRILLVTGERVNQIVGEQGETAW